RALAVGVRRLQFLHVAERIELDDEGRPLGDRTPQHHLFVQFLETVREVQEDVAQVQREAHSHLARYVHGRRNLLEQGQSLPEGQLMPCTQQIDQRKA